MNEREYFSTEMNPGGCQMLQKREMSRGRIKGRAWGYGSELILV